MVGIWGPAGIGKTTIARALNERLCDSFTHTAFIESIKGGHRTNDLDSHAFMLHLQEQLLCVILNQKDLKIRHLGVAEKRLKNKKVLLIMDDVHRLEQLIAMADKPQWFGRGSRIIITTQDQKLLKAHGIDNIYKVGVTVDAEARQIFCIAAFGQKSPKFGFEDLAQEVTKLSGKLPLGLRVMGTYFRGMSKQEWKDELPRLRTDSMSIFRFSYDALSDEDKDLFLYIACFFSHKSIQTLEDFLAKTFVNLDQGLHNLAQKSLISRECGFVKMHDLLVQLGREIVRNQSVHEPGKRQFLVDAREIYEVLTNETGSSSLVGMDLDLSEINGEFHVSDRAFERMCNLQLLRFYGRFDGSCGTRLYSPQSLKYISPKLRLLHWDFFPATRLPSCFIPEFLVELNMRYSKLEKLWEGVQPFQNLKWMDLSYSEDLKELPDLSTAINLLSLDLSYCIRLIELPVSIGNATNLLILNVEYCSKLVNMPSSIGNIPNLKIFLAECSSLVQLPSCIWNITSLSTFNLDNFSSSVQSSLMWNTKNFQDLDLSGCSSLKMLPSIVEATDLKVKFPSSIGNATNLVTLNLSGCSSLVKLPSSIVIALRLQELNLSGCTSLVELPCSIVNDTKLSVLKLTNCSSLVRLLFSIPNGSRLHTLNLSGCTSLVELPYYIGNATQLWSLNLEKCSSLVRLPSSIENLSNFCRLRLKGCSKLEALPTNINLGSQDEVDLTDCLLLKTFPQTSKKIRYLLLGGTAIEEVPSSITLWSRLEELFISYSENLGELPHTLNSITVLYLRHTEIRKVATLVKKFSRLRGLVIKGCRKLVSVSRLPGSLANIYVEPIQMQDCCFHHPQMCTNFPNCFKLNQEARDLIMETTSIVGFTAVPGREVPEFFTYRAAEDSVTVTLFQRPLPTPLRFKACILLVKDHDDINDVDLGIMKLSFSITSKQNDVAIQVTSPRDHVCPVLTKHLYIFEVEVNEGTSSELLFNFKLNRTDWKISECGVIQLLEAEAELKIVSKSEGEKHVETKKSKSMWRRKRATKIIQAFS